MKTEDGETSMPRKRFPGVGFLLLLFAVGAAPELAAQTPRPPAGEDNGAEEESTEAQKEVPLERFFKPYSELRFELSGADLQAMGTGESQMGFGVSRGRFGIEYRPSPALRSLLVIDIRQNGAVSLVPVGETGASLRLDSYAGDWEPLLPFAFVSMRGETGPVSHTVVAGVQMVTFGVRDIYGRDPGFHVPHPSAFMDLGRRSGVIPAFDLGLLYTAELEEPVPVALDAMVANGTGWRSVENNLGKSLIGRLRVTPVEPLELRATLLYGLQGLENETTIMAWQASAVARWGPARVLVEGLGGKSYAPDARVGFLGGAAAFSMDLDVPINGIDHISPVVTFQRYDPTTGVAAGDAWTLVAAGVSAYWATVNEQPMWTGLSWEMAITEDPTLPVGHSGVVQFGWLLL